MSEQVDQRDLIDETRPSTHHMAYGLVCEHGYFLTRCDIENCCM